MRLLRFFALLCVLSLWHGAFAAESAGPTVHMIGDSTMADKPVWPAQPERGWGQLLPLYFKDPNRVVNYAANGRSTKSFIDEGRWEKVRRALQPGDWLVIQFGHNDEKKDKPAVYADAHGAYQDNLRRFVKEAREAGARPLLATPIARRRFDAAGKLEDTHGEYPEALRNVARDENVPLLELNTLTSGLLQSYGAERSKLLFLWIPESDYPARAATSSKGWQDDTHLSAVGASRVAELAVGEILRLDLELKELLKLPAEKKAATP